MCHIGRRIFLYSLHTRSVSWDICLLKIFTRTEVLYSRLVFISTRISLAVSYGLYTEWSNISHRNQWKKLLDHQLDWYQATIAFHENWTKVWEVNASILMKYLWPNGYLFLRAGGKFLCSGSWKNCPLVWQMFNLHSMTMLQSNFYST